MKQLNSPKAKRVPDPKTPIDPRELEQAFSLFNLASEQLAATYAGLQNQVASLTQQLAIANGELKRQFLEKEALSQRLTALHSALPAGVVVLDESDHVIEANPAAEAMLGHALGGRAWPVVQACALRPSNNPEEWITSGHAAPRRLALSTSALPGSSGQILLFHDITQAHALQLELARHQRLSAMGEVAARLAHQLRTPLATALLYASQLSQAHLPEAERARFGEKVVARLTHLEHLIQDMLLYVRGEAGGREPIKVADLLADLRQVIEPQMLERGLVFQVTHGAGAARLSGSREAITGALVNLLENAMQWSPAGASVSLLSELAGEEVCLRVSDTGPGIEAATLERMFDPFFTTRPDGTGLGLAIVRGVAEAHGGEINVQSTPGSGAAVALRLPLLKIE
ncbi:MAG: PAS domain-containing sensor histidine kinase [Betaproteobacteria bacterium RBG_16_58_11]|nr:MAG: PAS domain-containing sensor histidine kinase [Betaproteobacteria bacterium RBG_16_58_11]